MPFADKGADHWLVHFFQLFYLTGFLLISSRSFLGSKNQTHCHYTSSLQPNQILSIKRSHGSQELTPFRALRRSR